MQEIITESDAAPVSFTVFYSITVHQELRKQSVPQTTHEQHQDDHEHTILGFSARWISH